MGQAFYSVARALTTVEHQIRKTIRTCESGHKKRFDWFLKLLIAPLLPLRANCL